VPARHRTSLFWLIHLALAVLLVGLPARDAPADGARSPLRYGQGLLWKVEAPGAAPSHIFGTVHSDDPRVIVLPPPVRAAFEGSRSFTAELIPNSRAAYDMAEAMFFNDGRTLAGVIGQPLYRETQQALVRHGLAGRDIERKKPWAVALALSTPPLKSAKFLDLNLQIEATLKNKPAYGLETAQEQLAVFNELSMADQTTMLRDTLRFHPQLLQEFETIIRTYLARDVAALLALDEKFKSENPALKQAIMHRLLGQRNRRMVERMQPRLKEGHAFVAIGAGHLPGDDGVLRLLEQAGYQVTRIY
jgi:hypothetical protein